MKIVDLVPRNNNSTFVGKIIELEVVEKASKVNPTKLKRFLKGVVGDETGVVRFDLGEKSDVAFKVGDIVSFQKAMNKVNKEGHHYVEVKNLGKYEILGDHADISVNTSVNKSEAEIPPLPEGERPVRVNKRVNNNRGERTESSNRPK